MLLFLVLAACGGKFCPVSIFTELHALSLVAHSYALLVLCSGWLCTCVLSLAFYQGNVVLLIGVDNQWTASPWKIKQTRCFCKVTPSPGRISAHKRANQLHMHVGLEDRDFHRIAGNFWGRKLSQISRFCGYSQKFSWWNLGHAIIWRHHAASNPRKQEHIRTGD